MYPTTHDPTCPALLPHPAACQCSRQRKTPRATVHYRFTAELIATAPTTIDLALARDFHARIMEIFDRDERTAKDAPDKLTRSERAGIMSLERKWRRRAAGQDRRWLLYGTRAGRLPTEIEAVLNPTKSDQAGAWKKLVAGDWVRRWPD